MTPEDEDLAIDLLAAVREAVGPRALLAIEAHSRFTPSSASGLLSGLTLVAKGRRKDVARDGSPQDLDDNVRDCPAKISDRPGRRRPVSCGMQRPD